MTLDCFLGTGTEEMYRVLENRDIGSTDTAVIHVGTNDIKRNLTLDCVMCEVY